MMDEVYAVVRIIQFVWAGLLSMWMIYWGIQDLMLSRRCGHVQLPPESTLFAASVLAANLIFAVLLTETFISDTVAIHWSLFCLTAFLLPASIATHQGAFRVKMHRISIQMGLCGGGHTHDDYTV